MDLARTWLPRALAALAFALYALAAPPGPYWLDAAELTAAAARLGSPHPTGFPLYCVLAKAATLVPVGELGFRLNLLSAVAGALAILWTTRLTLELGRDDLCGLIGAGAAGATLMVSLVFMRQATVAEIYAPNAALIAGALFLFCRVARGRGARWGLALAVVCGLGLALHITFALIAPVVIALVSVRLYRGARWPLVAPLLVVLVAGALLAYLPVRSATGRVDAVDWGHPHRAGDFVEHVSAARYRRAYGEEMRSTVAGVVGENARGFGQAVVDSLGPVAPLFALLGLVWLFRQRRSRWAAAQLAVVVAGDAVFSVWIHPWGMAELQNTVPLSLALCVAAGLGMAWFSRYLGLVGPYAAGVFCVLLVVPPALMSSAEVWPASSGDLPRAWAEAALEATPPRGVALVQNDSTAAGLLYLTAAEGARPDTAVLVRQHLHDVERTRAVLAASSRDAWMPGQAATTAAEWMDNILILDRPILWEIGLDATPPGAALLAGVPLSRLARDSEERDALMAAWTAEQGTRSDLRAALDRLVALFSHPSARDHAAEEVHAHALTTLGRLAYGRGDLDLAEALFAMAVQVRPEHASAWVNLGVVAARRRDYQAAIAHTEQALAVEPNRVSALVNAARYHVHLGDDATARARVERALRVDDRRADAWALSALLALRAGRREVALERIERALQIDPRDPDALDLLAQLRARQER